jgi:hypothetical protein
LDREEADKIAEDYFRTICGFNRESMKHKPRTESMMAAGISAREKISDSIHLRAILSDYGSEVVKDRAIRINDVSFFCNAFERIRPESSIRLYAYIVTAGEFELKDASITEQFFADTWGTAYVDAGRDILQKLIREDIAAFVPHPGKTAGAKDFFISDSFGPGYYGMEVTEIGHFFEILDGSKIGVTASAQSFMLPQKSCAGFFIAVNDITQLPGEDCRSCLAGKKGCNFCRFNVKKGE